jgi:peptidoglycan/xylan/chitin deacetylase (PgdA/CDA1 family)
MTPDPTTTTRIVSPLLAIAAALLLPACAGVPAARHQAAANVPAAPPASLSPHQVPQLVCFGSDDNGVSGLPGSGASGGLTFLTDLFAGRHNPAGLGNAATFDGAPIRYSFYVNTYYLEPTDATPAYTAAGRDEPYWVRRAWRQAIDAGHEIGVHTHSHPHGRELTVAQWEQEMRRCIAILERPLAAGETAESPDPAAGVGVQAAALAGFRTPYLEYSDATLAAAHAQGFRYDCSLEEGTQSDQDGTDFVWPYRLDAGSPGNPQIGRHPGLWEIPVYVFIVPPDDACERLGVPPGLRRTLKQRQDYFDVDAGKVTGMDWNLWCEFGMTPAEFLATITYTLELRLAGNRCPLTVGLHSEMYSDRQDTGECPTPVAARRAAVAALFDHVLSIPDVRVVAARDLVSWLEHPVPLGRP